MDGLLVVVVVTGAILAAIIVLVGVVLILLNWLNLKKETSETEIYVVFLKIFKLHIRNRNSNKK